MTTSTPSTDQDGRIRQPQRQEQVGGKHVGTISVDAAGFVRHIYREVEENLEYITEIEGIDIPKVWQDKILQPIDFAIQILEADDQVSDMAATDGEVK